MAVIELHTGVPSSPKHAPLSDAAFRLWTHGLCWSKEHLTDGFIPSRMLPTLHPRGRKVVGELLQTFVADKGPLWHVVDGGYQIHDYADWQETKDRVQGRRLAWREKKAGQRQGLRDESPSVSPGDTTRDARECPPNSPSDGSGGGRGRGKKEEPDPHTHTAPEADPPADDATARARAVDPSDDRPRPTGARPASNTGISTAGASWGAIPTRNRKAHCAYESAIGLDVPAVLHSELLAKACNAYPEMAPRDVEAWLLEWYAQTDAAYVGQAVGDDAFRFRRARFRETFGTTVREAPAKAAGLTGGGVTPRPRREADDNVWGRVLACLEAQLNRHTFASWLRDTRLASDTGDRLTIAVPDPTVGDWIARNYPTQIAAALRDLGREDVALAFTTEDTTR